MLHPRVLHKGFTNTTRRLIQEIFIIPRPRGSDITSQQSSQLLRAVQRLSVSIHLKRPYFPAPVDSNIYHLQVPILALDMWRYGVTLDMNTEDVNDRP